MQTMSKKARIVAAGGPLENVLLCLRMVSDVLGQTILLTDAVEVTSRGEGLDRWGRWRRCSQRSPALSAAT